MKLRILCSTACAALMAPPLAAQPAETVGDAEFDPALVDSMFGDAAVTQPAEEDELGEAQPDAGTPEEDVIEAEEPGEEPGTEAAADEADELAEPGGEQPETADDAEPAEDDPGPTDLDRAYAAYGQCVGEAAVELDAAGFAADQVGEEAVLRCSTARSAYVNAFYFSLLPRYPGETEQAVRAVAERLARQTDAHLAAHALDEGRAAAADVAEEADEIAEPVEAAADAADAGDAVETAGEPRTYDSPADVFAAADGQDVQIAQQGRRVTVVATRTGLEDDSVAGEEESVVLELGDGGLWHEVGRSTRYQCARGADAGEWTTELCP